MIELKKALETTGMSLGEVADLMGCSKATVSKGSSRRFRVFIISLSFNKKMKP